MQATCDLCGVSGAEIRYLTRSYGKGADLLVIEDVPVVVCPHCGESYLTAETLHKIEQIKLHPQMPAEATKQYSSSDLDF